MDIVAPALLLDDVVERIRYRNGHWTIRHRARHRVGVDTSDVVATVVVTSGGKAMKTIGVREFRDQATSLLASDETLVIERHGAPIGFYVPIAAKDRRTGREALGRLGSLVDEVIPRTGIDEDELVHGLTSKRRRR